MTQGRPPSVESAPSPRRPLVVAGVLVVTALVAVLLLSRSDTASGRLDAPLHGARRDAAPRTPRGATEPATVDHDLVVCVEVAEVGGARVLPDAWVVATRRGAPNAPALRRLTDAIGEARLEALGDGDWVVAVRCDGYLETVQPVPAAGSEGRRRMVVTLAKRARVAGRVLSGLGRAVAAATVQIRRGSLSGVAARAAVLEEPAGSDSVTGGTDDSGRFVLTGVRPETPLVLTVRHQTEGVAVVDLTPLTAGESRDVEVRLAPACSILGRLDRGSASDAPAWIDVIRIDGGALVQEARARVGPSEQAFQIGPLLPGPKVLGFQWRGPASDIVVGFVRVDLAEGEARDVGNWTAGSGRLDLLIVPADELPADTRADLLIQVLGSDLGVDLLPMHVVVPVGTPFALTGLPRGHTILTAALMDASGAGVDPRRGAAQAEADYDGSAGSVTIRIASHLSPKASAQIRCTARLPSGVEPQGARVKWVLIQEDRVLNAVWRAPAGHTAYSTPVVAFGRYRVQARCGRFVAERVVDLATGGADASLDAWDAAAGASGCVAGDAADVVRILLAAASATGERVVLDEATATADGEFAFEALPRIGALLLWAESSGASSEAVRIDGTRGAAGVRLVLKR